MKKFFTWLIPLVALFWTPLITGLERLSFLFNHIGTVFGVQLGIAGAFCLLALSLQPLPWVRRHKVCLEKLWLSAWFILIIHFLFQHTAEFRQHAPDFQAAGWLLGIAISTAFWRFLRLETFRTTVFWLSTAFLLADAIQVYSWDILRLREKTASAPIKTPQKPEHVFHILLDTFSVYHAERDSTAYLETLRQLSEKHNLTYYKRHFANASFTDLSVPDFLRIDRSMKINRAFSEEDENVLFKAFHDRHYKVSLHGQGLPYCRLFSRWTQICKTADDLQSPGSTLLRTSLLFLYEISNSFVTLFLADYFRELISGFPRGSLDMVETFIRDHPREYFEQSSTYSYLHLILPHDPLRLDEHCVFHPEWREKDYAKLLLEGINLRRYQAQVHCALKQVDRVLNYLNDLGIEDQSRILIHSDHGIIGNPAVFLWNNPNLKEEETNGIIERTAHVAALTKTPGQKKASWVKKTTSNASVGEFLLSAAPPKQLPEATSVPFRYGFYNQPKVHLFLSDGRGWKKIGEE